MRKRLWLLTSLAIVFGFITITQADWPQAKTVTVHVRNANGGIPDAPEAGQGVSHSSYLQDISLGQNTNVETGIGSGQVAVITGPTATYFDITFTICGPPPFYKVLWDINGGTDNYQWAAGDILVTTITDNYGEFNGETRTFNITLDSNDEQEVPADDASLPVHLSLFQAESGNEQVRLTWQTESEVNCLGFFVLRSIIQDSVYVRLTNKIIKGAGSSSSLREYVYLDKQVENEITYYYKLEEKATDGASTLYGPVSATPSLSFAPIPTCFELYQSYPNPFNAQTIIEYGLPKASHVKISIYNLLGQELIKLIDEDKKAGYYSVVWNGRDNQGKTLGSGVYIIRMTAGSFVQSQKVTLLR